VCVGVGVGVGGSVGVCGWECGCVCVWVWVGVWVWVCVGVGGSVGVGVGGSVGVRKHGCGFSHRKAGEWGWSCTHAAPHNLICGEEACIVSCHTCKTCPQQHWIFATICQ